MSATKETAPAVKTKRPTDNRADNVKQDFLDNLPPPPNDDLAEVDPTVLAAAVAAGQDARSASPRTPNVTSFQSNESELAKSQSALEEFTIDGDLREEDFLALEDFLVGIADHKLCGDMLAQKSSNGRTWENMRDLLKERKGVYLNFDTGDVSFTTPTIGLSDPRPELKGKNFDRKFTFEDYEKIIHRPGDVTRSFKEAAFVFLKTTDDDHLKEKVIALKNTDGKTIKSFIEEFERDMHSHAAKKSQIQELQSRKEDYLGKGGAKNDEIKRIEAGIRETKPDAIDDVALADQLLHRFSTDNRGAQLAVLMQYPGFKAATINFQQKHDSITAAKFDAEYKAAKHDLSSKAERSFQYLSEYTKDHSKPYDAKLSGLMANYEAHPADIVLMAQVRNAHLEKVKENRLDIPSMTDLENIGRFARLERLSTMESFRRDSDVQRPQRTIGVQKAFE